MLEMRKDANRRYLHWVDVLAEVKRDLTQTEMDLAGQVCGEIVNIPCSTRHTRSPDLLCIERFDWPK